MLGHDRRWKISSFKCGSLIANEPTRAAIAYGTDKKVDNQWNVFFDDLSWGSLEASILLTGGGTPLDSEESVLDWRMTVRN